MARDSKKRSGNLDTSKTSISAWLRRGASDGPLLETSEAEWNAIAKRVEADHARKGLRRSVLHGLVRR